MDDAQAAKLRELAERAKAADDAADRAESEGARSDEPQAAINDAEDATQDFRNEANYDAILALLDERDAAMALLRECRERVEDYDAMLHSAGGSRELVLLLLNRIDAMLGDGGEGDR